MTTNRKRAMLVLLATWLGVVGVVTLRPTGPTPPLTFTGFACIGCGWAGAADVISNWLMFLPGGVLVALLLDVRRAVLVAACLTVAVETVQIGVPGRDPALQDLLFNTLGAWSGAFLATRGLGRRGKAALTWVGAAVWLAPAWLLVPQTSQAELYGQWTPALGGMQRYEGRVIEATVGGVAVPSGRAARKADLDMAIVDRQPIRLLIQAASPPSSLAPVFRIADADGLEVLLLAARGDDLLLRGHTRARVMKLNQPDARWSGALADATPSDTVAVHVDRGRGSVCMSVAERRKCGVAPSLANGWGHLLGPEPSQPWLRTLVSITWAVALGLLVGLSARSPGSALLRGGGLAGVGLIVSALSPDLRTDLPAALLLTVSSWAGSNVPLRLAARLPRAAPAPTDPSALGLPRGPSE